MGAVVFGIPRELVLWLRDTFKVDIFVETGTNLGETAVWASENFKRVLTIERYEPLYRRAKETFGDRKNIQFLDGDSRTHIKSLVASLTEPAIFWLDAHWCGEQTFGKTEECPILGELELLNTSKVAHIVLIDDARFFLSPPPFPHEPTHWPDIATICRLLCEQSTNRYVIVHDDVIIAVPEVAKPRLIEFVRREAHKNGLPSPRATVRRLPLNRLGFEKLLVPIYLPRWMSRSLLKLKRALIPPHEATKKIKISADFAPKYKPEEHWLVKSGIKTILDVGAHKGEFAQRIRAILPDADLVCFEPLREPFLALSRRFAGQPNFLALQCALGDKPAQCEIHRNEYTPSSSLLPMTALHKRSFTFAVEEETEVIEVRRLSDVARELNLRDPLLLKLDVQGFEDKVITGGEDVVARADIIIIEVSFLPLFEGGPLFDHIYQILKTRGFTYNGQFDQLLSPADGRPLQADAIFCRA